MLQPPRGPRKALGRAGKVQRVDRRSIGWTGHVADPRSPAGSGGPGNFDHGVGLDAPGTLDVAFGEPAPVRLDDNPVSEPRPPNHVGATKERSLGTLLEESTAFIDVKVAGKIMEDKIGGGPHTDFSFPDVDSAVGFDLDADEKVTKFNGKFKWKGTLKIQTSFGSTDQRDDVQCYGRGTTDADVRNRDITIGFHEKCHRADYAAYVKANPLPKPPKLALGMKGSAVEAAIRAFTDAFDRYHAAMTADSISKTDEVGFTKTKADDTGDCYVHLVP